MEGLLSEREITILIESLKWISSTKRFPFEDYELTNILNKLNIKKKSGE